MIISVTSNLFPEFFFTALNGKERSLSETVFSGKCSKVPETEKPKAVLGNIYIFRKKIFNTSKLNLSDVSRNDKSNSEGFGNTTIVQEKLNKD